MFLSLKAYENHEILTMKVASWDFHEKNMIMIHAIFVKKKSMEIAQVSYPLKIL